MSYYSRKLKLPFQDVLNKVTENLKQQGFGIITTIDVKDTFKQKLNMPFRNYKILGACNPQFAFKAITLESHMGVMLPCNVVVQEHEMERLKYQRSIHLKILTDPLIQRILPSLPQK